MLWPLRRIECSEKPTVGVPHDDELVVPEDAADALNVGKLFANPECPNQCLDVLPGVVRVEATDRPRRVASTALGIIVNAVLVAEAVERRNRPLRWNTRPTVDIEHVASVAACEVAQLNALCHAPGPFLVIAHRFETRVTAEFAWLIQRLAHKPPRASGERGAQNDDDSTDPQQLLFPRFYPSILELNELPRHLLLAVCSILAFHGCASDKTASSQWISAAIP